jgi:hypothetical protein
MAGQFFGNSVYLDERTGLKCGGLRVCKSETLIPFDESLIEVDSPLKKLLSECGVLCGHSAEIPEAPLVSGRLAHRALLLGLGDRDRHVLADLVLDGEDVGEVAVVALGLDMVAGLGLDQLCGDVDAIWGFAHAAFEHISHA